MSPQEFIYWLAPSAQSICRRYSLFASVCVAQAALESGWGKYGIGQYNLFGRKWDGQGPFLEKTTKEYLNGEWLTIVDKFKDYGTLEEAVDDWCVLITQEPLYAACLDSLHDREQFVRTLGPIYATDPEYANKVIRIIAANGLEEWD